jgi:hypothetical protein
MLAEAVAAYQKGLSGGVDKALDMVFDRSSTSGRPKRTSRPTARPSPT